VDDGNEEDGDEEDGDEEDRSGCRHHAVVDGGGGAPATPGRFALFASRADGGAVSVACAVWCGDGTSLGGGGG